MNALAGGEVMRTSGIREKDGRGRHTTTHRQLLLLENGVLAIDTPGMRELGMWEAEEGISRGFPDVEEHLGHCRFSDCSHQGEPGCAVAEAIRRGEISPERWESYRKLREESRLSGSKADFLREKQRRQKELSKTLRQWKKADYRHEPCMESFTCKVCGALVTPGGRREPPPQPLSPLPVERPCRQPPGGPGVTLRGHDGPHRRLGAQGRGVGPHPPLPGVRRAQLEPDRGGRQPRPAHGPSR